MATRLFVGAGQRRTSPNEPSTAGALYRSTVGNGGWERVPGLPPVPARAIAIHPKDPRTIYAGSAAGAFRSRDGGDTWQPLALPEAGLEVWSFLFHPGDPRTMYLGTAPAGVFRSGDGGDTWTKCSAFRSPGRVSMNFPCRVLRLAADPSAPRELYAGIEVDGVVRSLDAGEHWDDVSHELVKLAERPHLKSRIASDTEIEGMMDSHALCVSPARPGTVFLAVRMGLFRSADRGKTWEDMEIGRFSPLTYARDVKLSPHDPRTLFTCLSPAARSEAGSLYRSDDLGTSWRRIDHGVTAHSTMMAVALHGQDPDQVYCVARGGQVFGTQDGGRSWKESHLPEGTEDCFTVACA